MNYWVEVRLNSVCERIHDGPFLTEEEAQFCRDSYQLEPWEEDAQEAGDLEVVVNLR